MTTHTNTTFLATVFYGSVGYCCGMPFPTIPLQHNKHPFTSTDPKLLAFNFYDNQEHMDIN